MNKAKIKSFFKSFTPYQIIYLSAVILLTAAFLIFFPEYMLDEEARAKGAFVVTFFVIDTLANPLCELLISKQSKWNFVIDFVFIEIAELVTALVLGWYTLAATIVLFWIPIDVVSFIRWNKHPDAEDENLTEVKRLKPWQSLLIVAGIIAFGLFFGWAVQNIPGANESYWEAFASAVGMANGVLLLLRYSEQWIAWLITSVLYLIMDIKSGSYILTICEVAMIVNTVYGMIKWYFYIKNHQGAKSK